MSSKNIWPQDYMVNPRVMQAHEAFVDMFNGRTPFNLLDALSLSFGIGEVALEQDVSDSSESECDRSLQPYCGLSRNFLQRSRPRVSVESARTVTREAEKKAEKTAEELIEEEERLKKKAEKKRLKKLRQKEKKRLEKQGKENANKADSKLNKGEGIKKNQNKSPPDAGPQSNSDSSSEEEDEDDGIFSEKKHREKQLQKQEKKKSSKTNDKQTLNSNEDVSIKKKNLNKSSAVSHPDKGLESSSDADEEDDGDEEKDHVHSDLEELDMSSCFVSNAAAAIVKRKLEKAKEKDKKDKRPGDSGKDSQKPSVEQQNSKAHLKGVTPLATQNQVKADKEASVADLVARSMELAYIGNQYAASGNLEMAVKYFTDAIMHNPREYKLFGNRSFCFEKMQQYEKSLMDANVALSMNPQWIKGLYRKGRALTGLKRYMEAMFVYKEVLTLDSSCTDATQELINVQILQLMEMGFTREQSTNAIIIHGSVDKALEALSGLRGSCIPVSQPSGPDDWVRVEKRSQSPKPAPPKAQQPVPRIQPQPQAVKRELFPVWVGCPVPSLTEAFFYDLFNQIGPVHSVKFLRSKGCAFVNYIRKEDSEKAIKKLHGHLVAGGIPLTVRFPDRIHPHLGVSKAAAYECKDKLPDECYFWRTTGCNKNQNCQYRHVPENQGIDRNKFK